MRDTLPKLGSIMFSFVCCLSVAVSDFGTGTGGTQIPGILVLAILSIALFASGGHSAFVWIFLGGKVVTSLLIGIPLHAGDGQEELLMYSLVVECLLYLPEIQGLTIAAFALFLSVIGQHEWKTLDGIIPAATRTELFTYTTHLGLVFLMASGLKRLYEANRAQTLKLGHLESSIQGVIEANLDLQGYAVKVERSTTEAERKRITREIHDIIGWSMTNQLMMLEAGLLLVEKDPPKLKAMLSDAKMHLQESLGDIRKALRHMRAAEIETRTNLDELRYLCNIFGEATGIEIRLELAIRNPGILPEMFHCMYRIIQQSLTNALFHGRATRVDVAIQETDSVLFMTIEDNGRNGQQDAGIQEGIGLAGMKERLEPFGGELRYRNSGEGFHLSVKLPIAERAVAGKEET